MAKTQQSLTPTRSHVFLGMLHDDFRSLPRHWRQFRKAILGAVRTLAPPRKDVWVQLIPRMSWYTLTKNDGKSPFLMGKFTISMAMFNSYVSLPEGMVSAPTFVSPMGTLDPQVMLWSQHVWRMVMLCSSLPRTGQDSTCFKWRSGIAIWWCQYQPSTLWLFNSSPWEMAHRNRWFTY